MKVCLMCEGSYPYVTGGVSSWVHMLMTHLKDIEFYISAIVVDREHGGKFKYKMPPNLVSINEIYLQDDDIVRFEKKLHLSRVEKEAFRSFVLGGSDIDWPTIFNFFANRDVSINSLLMGNDLLDILHEFYDKHYNRIPFSDFLWTYRSMLLPICLLMKNELPKADIYHSASTGYSGVLACMAKHLYKKPAIITEHGIYTREREEDIIRSPFFGGVYKDIWIEHFYKLSSCAYKYSDLVVSLFDNARELQIDIGCDPKKTMVVANGVVPDRFDDVLQKEHTGIINLGIIARISPIKDIKTLINSFAAAKERVPNIHLYIMGGYEEDDVPYYEECVDLVKSLGLKDVVFTGVINVNDYIGWMDILILTSISEGQPIAALEAMSARKPFVATNVGDCKGLLYGYEKGDKPCGIVAPIMSVEHLSNAIVELATNEKKRKQYGDVARQRIDERYTVEKLIDSYDKLYKSYGMLRV